MRLRRAADICCVCANDSIALGTDSVADKSFTISVGDASDTSVNHRIVNMAAGLDSNDAVNVSQVASVGDTIAKALSSNSSLVADGSGGWTLTTSLTVGGNTYNNVQDALNALYGNIGGGYSGWKLQVNGGDENEIADGDTVTLASGSNIEITEDSGTYTFSVVNNPEFTSVSVGSYTISGTSDGLGLDMGGARLTNLADG